MIKSLGHYLRLWRAAGGQTFGPRVEHWSIEESKVSDFIGAVESGAIASVTEEVAALRDEAETLRSYLASTCAMIQQAIGQGRDVFIEPDTGRRLSDAQALIAELVLPRKAEG